MICWSMVFMPVVFLIAQSALAAQPSAAEMDELATDKACYLCHRAEPADRKSKDALPYAPSWKEIALMYRGQEGAEDRLTEVVLWGSKGDGKDRHWKGRVIDPGMLPNVKEIDEDEARRLVRWILSFSQ